MEKNKDFGARLLICIHFFLFVVGHRYAMFGASVYLACQMEMKVFISEGSCEDWVNTLEVVQAG